MPFLNFGGNKYKYCNLSDMNFFMKNRYSDPDPIFPNADPRIRIHYYGKVDPDPLFPIVDPRIRIHVKMRLSSNIRVIW